MIKIPKRIWDRVREMQRMERQIQRAQELSRAELSKIRPATVKRRYERYGKLQKELSKEFLPVIKGLVKAGLFAVVVEAGEDWKINGTVKLWDSKTGKEKIKLNEEYAWVGGMADEVCISGNYICLISEIGEASDTPQPRRRRSHH